MEKLIFFLTVLKFETIDKEELRDLYYVYAIYTAVLLYCLNCRKNIKSKDSEAAKTNKVKLLPLLKCIVRNSKKSSFIKKQEASGLLSNLGLKTPLRKILLLGDISLFSVRYKMNEIVNQFFLTGVKFMPEIHLRHNL